MRHALHQYEEALSLGKAHRLPDERVESMGHEYFKLLVDTKQEERAAALKEKEVPCGWSRSGILKCVFPGHDVTSWNLLRLVVFAESTGTRNLDLDNKHDQAAEFKSAYS